MTTEAQKIAELATQAHGKPATVEIHHGGLNAEVLLVPNGAGGYHQHSVKKLLEEYRDAPERRTGTAVLTDLESFIAHTKRFADTDSAVFVGRSGNPSLTSVLDYHRAGAASAPRFGKHRGVYQFPLSDEWVAWNSTNGKSMGQEEFARWLEDHLGDVADPKSAGDTAKAFVSLLSCGFAGASTLLGLSRGLEIHVGSRVKQHVKLSSGESTVAFDEAHSDGTGAPVKVPGAFLLGIPVFRNGELYQVPTRLRYRVSAGGISWSFEMHRTQAILDHAIREACLDVAEETGLPVYEGSPE